MDIKEIIEIGCVKNKMSVSDLAREINTSKQNLFNKLTRNNLKFSDLEELCNVLGIEIKFIKDGKEL